MLFSGKGSTAQHQEPAALPHPSLIQHGERQIIKHEVIAVAWLKPSPGKKARNVGLLDNSILIKTSSRFALPDLFKQPVSFLRHHQDQRTLLYARREERSIQHMKERERERESSSGSREVLEHNDHIRSPSPRPSFQKNVYHMQQIVKHEDPTATREKQALPSKRPTSACWITPQ